MGARTVLSDVSPATSTETSSRVSATTSAALVLEEVVEIVVCLEWLAVVSTLGMARKEKLVMFCVK